MVRWHHRLDGHEFEQTLGVGEGQGSLECCSPWGRKGSDTTERLNNKQNENAPTDAGEDARRTLRLMDPSVSIIAAKGPPQPTCPWIWILSYCSSSRWSLPHQRLTNLLWPKRLTSKFGLGTSQHAPCLLLDSW